MQSTNSFILATILFAPLLAIEDGLRLLGADVPKEGMNKNKEGKGFLQIWQESGNV